MATIVEAIKEQVCAGFRHTIFPQRSAECISSILTMPVHGSDTLRVIPKPTSITIERVDETSDKVNLLYNDLGCHYVFHWRECDFPKGWLLDKVE